MPVMPAARVQSPFPADMEYLYTYFPIAMYVFFFINIYFYFLTTLINNINYNKTTFNLVLFSLVQFRTTTI